MKNDSKLVLLCFLFLLIESSAKAQNYNISILPARVIYNYKLGTNLFFAYKHLEVEKRMNDKYSLSLALQFNLDSYKSFAGSYRDFFYQIEPNVKHYFNLNSKGPYLGSGLGYTNLSFKNSGRFASDDERIKESKAINRYFEINAFVGYKFAIINDRLSLDFKINQPINILAIKNEKILYSNNLEDKSSNTINQNRFYANFFDFKLGYRFGYKK